MLSWILLNDSRLKGAEIKFGRMHMVICLLAVSVSSIAAPASSKVRITVAVPVVVTVGTVWIPVEASPASAPAHKCHAKSGVGFGRDFLDLELDTIDGGGAGLEELLGRLFLCEGDKAEIFSFILSFVKWLLHLKVHYLKTVQKISFYSITWEMVPNCSK